MQIFNGTTEIYLKANSIKEKVEWTNALLNCQKQCLEGRYDQFKKKNGYTSPSKNFEHSIKDNHYSEVSGGYSNEKPGIASGGSINWHEQLNMAFCAKMFKPDGPFFTRLG